MSDIRQMPLFPTLPTSDDDLNPHTRLRDTVTLFQRYLLREGKSEHTVKSFTSDLQLVIEHCGGETEIGAAHTVQPERISRLDGAPARRVVQPQDLCPPRDDAQGLFQMAARSRRDPARPGEGGLAAVGSRAAGGDPLAG